MAEAGYGEGYIEGLQVMSGLADHRQARQMRAQQMQAQRQAAQDSRQERSVLANIFQARAESQNQLDLTDQNDKLAQQYRQAGQQLMGINPGDALKFLQEGDRVSEHNADRRVALARAEHLKGEYLASSADTVKDQDSLTEFVQVSARAGQPVPAKYQVWNSATQSYLKRAVEMSLPISKRQEVALKTKDLEIRGRVEDRKLREEEAVAKQDAAKEVRARAGIVAKTKALELSSARVFKLKNQEEGAQEVTTLKGMPGAEGFSKLEAKEQLAAAAEVRYRAQSLWAKNMKDGEEGMEMDEALEQARESVLKEYKVKSGGWFGKDTAERVKGGVETKEARPESLPMPASKAEMQTDKIYQTPRGLARWKGDHFEAVK